MDEVVARAIAKWPNVPAVYGWLSLDRRGNWAIKGQRVSNRLVAEFIGRNYASDEKGRWFFQNGPQRVFVQLAYTPLVYRTRAGPDLAFASHTGQPVAQARRAWLDEHGALLIETELGIGLLHDRDLADALTHFRGPDGAPLGDDAIERLLDEAAGADVGSLVQLHTGCGPLPVHTVLSEELPLRFGFDPDPRPAPGEPEC